MKPFVYLYMFAMCILLGCSEPIEKSGIGVQGKWIRDADGQVMLDPQTSGLKVWRGKLISISDASGDAELQRHLIPIQADTATLSPPNVPIVLSEEVQKGCFADYLGAEPDYEGIAVDPENDNIVYLVTEDATRSGGFSPACKKRYSDTGSTEYPTLLVKLQIQADQSAMLTGVRPLQFAPELNVGDHPNDGFEALAFGQNRTLYLGLEKDADSQPRIFSVVLNNSFWQSQEFAAVQDPGLLLPTFEQGAHPINGMDHYLTADGQGYLLAAARNDEQLWIIDTQAQQPTKLIQLHFLAETQAVDESCQPWEAMHNASIEGVAVEGETLWMVNDPWRKNYHKNIQCLSNKQAYQKMAPLLFKMPIEPSWFE